MIEMEIVNSFKFHYRTGTEIAGIGIDSCEVLRVKIPLNLVFEISLASQEFYDGIIVKLVSGDITGYGEAETIAEITGETPEVLFNISSSILMALNGRKVEGLEDFSEFLNNYCYGNTAAKSAIDIAFYDLLGKSLNVHVVKISGGSFKPRKTSLTIPISPKKESLKLLETYQNSGAKIIKVKIGNNLEKDIDRIKSIAGNIREDVSFFADANQGYNLNSAIKMAQVLNKYEAIFFEQPVNRFDLTSARELRHKSGIPIMLDESVFSPMDAMNVIRQGAADMINVKLSKSGGIHQAIKVLTVAQAAGVDAMVGCMLESKLGIAASLVAANSVNNVKFTDLDGFTYLSEQPFEGGVELKLGMDYLVAGPGFAVKLKENQK